MSIFTEIPLFATDFRVTSGTGIHALTISSGPHSFFSTVKR
jgi:hypothetical protein